MADSPIVERIAEEAWLVYLPGRNDLGALARVWRSRLPAGITELTSAYDCLGVYGETTDELVRRFADELALEPLHVASGRRHRIPVCFDLGLDTAFVCESLGLTIGELEVSFSVPLRVQMLGFQPGFPYCYAPDRIRGLARQSSPRSSVPAGSLAVALDQAGIYPDSSPGGWNLVGQTPLRICAPENCYFPIQSGDELLCYPVDEVRFRQLRGKMLRPVRLNVDAAEGLPWDRQAIERADEVNLCGGEHAGSWSHTVDCADYAASLGKKLIAHPGYPDRARFGRCSPNSEEVVPWLQSVLQQLERFKELGISTVKPHGALYHDLNSGFAPAVELFQVWFKENNGELVGLPGGGLESLATEVGIAFIPEGFVDRRYSSDHALVSRNEPHALHVEEQKIREQVERLAWSGIETLCAHGDEETCLEKLDWAREVLEDLGFRWGAP